MYRLLDKRFGRVNMGGTVSVPVWFDLRDFACGNIGLTEDYAAWKLKQVLRPASRHWRMPASSSRCRRSGGIRRKDRGSGGSYSTRT